MTVDSGAMYPVVPRRVLDDLRIRPTSRLTFTLANGTWIEREVAQAGFSYDGQSATGPVVVGEADDMALLGAHALEGLGLEIDPVAGTLRPTTLYLL